MVYSECVTRKTPFLEVTYPEIEKREKRFNLFHLNKKNPERELFIKSFNEKEFVGEEICRMRNIESAHYFLVGINSNSLAKYRRTNYYGDIKTNFYKFMIGSYDFRKRDKEYFELDYLNLGDNPIEELLSLCPNDENRDELLHEVLELIALDVFMGQEDRCSKNIMIEKDKYSNLHLAPLYDFQYSLNIPSLRYESGFKSFKSNKDYYEFMNQYGEFRDLLEFYSDEDLYSITENAFNKHSMRIPENEKEYLKDYSKSRKKLIKNILK